MTFFEGLIRFILGGTLVLLVSIVSKSGKSTAAGIIALFPVITAVSFTLLAQTVDINILRNSVLTAILSLPATLAFLLAFYFCVGRMNIILTLVICFILWLIAATLVYYFRVGAPH